MPGIFERFTDGWERAFGALALVVVPILFACTEVSKIQSVLAHDGVYFGFTFGVPLSVGTVWQFVNYPTLPLA